MRVLVTYATKKGSTESIAERISNRLSNDVNISSTILPVSETGDVTSFDAVVVGSCIQAGSWIKPAKRFVSANAAVLAMKPVWAFSVGCPQAFSKNSREMAMKERDTIMKTLEQDIQLKGHALLEGYWRREDWGAIMRCVWSCFGFRWGDYRNWDAVDQFADGIAQELKKGR
jgi:menaquinone-dependent protoporphyrinogen oxidase